ncbi:hypothetical protein BaRGS_00030368 [Batillaria attramentaria]|uniref:Uncharacterized protein n=1 Tax=Batillaria attramentaria TaxID=370345 RepID=A0ABD0JUK0_9CAEN
MEVPVIKVYKDPFYDLFGFHFIFNVVLAGEAHPLTYRGQLQGGDEEGRVFKSSCSSSIPLFAVPPPVKNSLRYSRNTCSSPPLNTEQRIHKNTRFARIVNAQVFHLAAVTSLTAKFDNRIRSERAGILIPHYTK